MKNGYEEFFRKVKKNNANKNTELIKPKAKIPDFNLPMIMLLGMTSLVLGLWTYDPEFPERILNKIEIQFLAQSGAAEPAEAKETNAAKPAAEQAEGTKEEKAEASPSVAEDVSHLAKLRERKEALDLREKELNQLEEELHKQRVEIEGRISKLNELRTEITTLLKERVEGDQEKVMRLVDTYSTMKPKQAADIIAGMNEDLAVEVLAKMKKKNAAEIMNLLESGKARSISEKYAGYKKR